MRGALGSNRSVLYGVTVRVAIAAVVVGVFCTWLAEDRLTLSGIEGPNNGWLCVLLAGPALLWARSMERGSWVGVVGVLAGALVIGWTATENWLDASRVLDTRVSYGLLLVLAASVVLAAVAVVRAVSLLRDPARPVARTPPVVGLGQRWPSSSSCSRFSSSSSSGRCSGSRSGRAGRPRQAP